MKRTKAFSTKLFRELSELHAAQLQNTRERRYKVHRDWTSWTWSDMFSIFENAEAQTWFGCNDVNRIAIELKTGKILPDTMDTNWNACNKFCKWKVFVKIGICKPQNWIFCWSLQFYSSTIFCMFYSFHNFPMKYFSFCGSPQIEMRGKLFSIFISLELNPQNDNFIALFRSTAIERTKPCRVAD